MTTEPLTIYECPTCGHRAWSDVACVGGRMAPNHGAEHQIVRCQPVRVFREEDVRPLWEAAMNAPNLLALADAFPAPEEWNA